MKIENAKPWIMLGTAACAGMPLLGNAQSKDPNRPNILCVVCEDISPYLGCYGDPVAKTPNLDKFSKEAIRFTNMHCQTGVSSPSRYGLITGCYPSAHGANYMRAATYDYEVVTPENMRAYTEFMRQAGYFVTNNSKTDYQIGVTPAQWDENSPKATWKNCPEGQPFLSIFNIMTTHESMMWFRKDPLEIQPEDIDMSRFPYFPDCETVRKDLARMYTNIAIMDRESQKFFDELKEAGLEDNTIIIWYSDNGGPIPRGKRSIYETGSNVPFMIKFPNGYRAGQTEDRLCQFVDIPATILSLAGVKIPDYMEGQAFFGSQASAPREYVYQCRDRYDNVTDHSASVRDHRFQYVRNYMPETCNYLDNDYRLSLPTMKVMLEMRDKGQLNEDQMKYFKAPRPVEEFYDIQNDPYELHNLADDPAFKYDLERLRKAFNEWNNTVNLAWDTKTEQQWIDEFKPNGEFQVVENPLILKNGTQATITCATPGSSIIYKIQTVKEKKQADAELKLQLKKAEEEAKTNPYAKLMGGAIDASKGWKYYTGPIQVKKGEIVTAMACRAGFKNSAQVSLK